MIRRTITVEDFVNSAINTLRGLLLQKHGLELDFTTVINMYAEIGILHSWKVAQEKADQPDPILKYVAKKYNQYDSLKIQALGDQITEIALARVLPKELTK